MHCHQATSHNVQQPGNTLHFNNLLNHRSYRHFRRMLSRNQLPGLFKPFVTKCYRTAPTGLSSMDPEQLSGGLHFVEVFPNTLHFNNLLNHRSYRHFRWMLSRNQLTGLFKPFVTKCYKTAPTELSSMDPEWLSGGDCISSRYSQTPCILTTCLITGVTGISDGC